MADEYNLPLGLDIERVVQNARRVSGILSDLNNQALNMGNATASAFNNASQAANNASRNIANQAAAYGNTTRSVENMRDALNDLRNMAFSETDTARIRFYNQEIQRLEAQIRQTGNIGRAGFDDMGNRIQAAGRQVNTFGDSLKKIGGYLLAAFSVTAIIAFGKELFTLATKADGIERAFSRIGDSKGLAKLRAETRGFVSDLDLQRLTVKAENFNIPLEKMGTLLAFASQRAKDTGEDVDKLTNNIIDGLGRKSSRIIDNLGISIVDIQKEFKKTGDFTTAVSNLIQREMSDAGAPVDTLADKANRISTAFLNAKQNLAGFLARLFNPDAADNDVVGNITKKAQQSFGDINKSSSKDIIGFISKQVDLVNTLSKNYIKVQGDIEKQALGNKSTFESLVVKPAAEQLQAAKNVLQNLKDQRIETEKRERIAKNIVSIAEMEQKVSKLRDDAKNIIPGVDGTAADRTKMLKEADAIQKQIDELTGKAQAKRDKSDISAAAKRKARQQLLAEEMVRLENEFATSQIEAIEDVTTRAVESEKIGTLNRVRELQQRAKEFPELEKQYAKNIEEIKINSEARIKIIERKGAEDRLQVRKASQTEISKVLKEDTAVQIDAINDSYDLLRQNAKKAGTFSAEVEAALVKAQAKAISDVTIKAQDETLKKQEENSLSGIYVRKKRESQSEKAFERENQADILEIQIEFAEKRLALIATDPAKIKEANVLRKAIQDATGDLNKLRASKSEDLLDLLGINPEKLKVATEAISKVGNITSDLFSGLGELAQQRVDSVQIQIDAIDALVEAQEDAVAKEKDLMDKGFANNFDNAQKTLAAQKVQREKLLKEQEEAQKKQQALQRAQIISDSISQASNLVTASTDIFKVFAKIPIIGVPLGIAAVATMLGAFAISKVNAFNATKLAEGGTIGGKSHSDGGNKYISLDGQSFMEHERGEEVTKKTSAEKHRKLLKAINSDDFSKLSMSDYSIQELLKGTGVISQLEEAKKASENNITVTERNKTIVINGAGNSEKYLKSINERMERIEQDNKNKSVVTDFGEYIIIKTGNRTQKVWKK